METDHPLAYPQMSFDLLAEQEPMTLKELCAQECTSDISPAEIRLTPICRADVEPLIITCAEQLNGTSVELMQAFSSRKTQCSTEDAGKIPSGKSAKFDVSLAEAEVPPELLELVYQGQWSDDPYNEGGTALNAYNNAGECPIRFKAEICPRGGTVDLVFPYAQLFTETISLSYNNTDQREVTLSLYASEDPRTGIVYQLRPKSDRFEFDEDQSLLLPA